MSSRTQSHQLKSGLYVSGRGRPDTNTNSNPRTPTLSTRPTPYTGGDLSKSGELAKMFDLNFGHSHSLSSTSSQPSTPKIPSRNPSQPNSGSGPQPPVPAPVLSHAVPSRLSNSGALSKKSSGSMSGSVSGSVLIHPTGLITSGPLTSSGGPGPGRRSGQLDVPVRRSEGKMVYGAAVTSMGKEGVRYGVKVSRVVMWVFGIVVLMGLLVGVFLMVAVKKPIILVAVGAVLVPVLIGLMWNWLWKTRAVLGYVSRFPDTELRGAVDGQFVKVTGVVTCGSIPLESSFQRVPRCVYASTELYEYKGWGGKSANPKHRCFSWGSRHSEKYVADFYVSDFHSGLRALVKSGYGAKVVPLVEPATVVDITKEKRDLSPNFLQWLADRSLSGDDRVMRLKEGYVKEGSTVSVMGVVRRQENIVMIVPPTDPISTGCQWLRCLLPMYVDGLILHCEDNQNAEVIPV